MNTKLIYDAERVDVYCLSLQQLCRCAEIEQTIVCELVESEILKPQGDSFENWLFLPEDLSRLTRASRLMHEFELGPIGLALVFDLLEQLQQLRRSDI